MQDYADDDIAIARSDYNATSEDTIVIKAKNYARHYFMAHAHHGAGYLSLAAALAMALAGLIALRGFGASLYSAPVKAIICCIVMVLAGLCALVLTVVWHHFSDKANCFVNDAVVNDGNLTKQEIRGYYKNYAV